MEYERQGKRKDMNMKINPAELYAKATFVLMSVSTAFWESIDLHIKIAAGSIGALVGIATLIRLYFDIQIRHLEHKEKKLAVQEKEAKIKQYFEEKYK